MVETTSVNELEEKWELFNLENPKVRIRDAASILKTSEAQLLATSCGRTVTRLDGGFKHLFKNEIPLLGEVKAITRNDDVVHERVGKYKGGRFSENSDMGLFVGKDIDLRMFMQHWHSCFSVEEETKAGTRRSLQFFDKYGTALHKIYLTNNSNLEAFNELTKTHQHKDQSTYQATLTKPEVLVQDRVKEAVDSVAFQQDWIDLKDTHDFFGLLRKFDLTRIQALELAPEAPESYPFDSFAHKVPESSLVSILESVAEQQVPIMVFVGNHGIIQIHTGEIKKLLEIPNWYNIMDPDFNLHVKLTSIKEAWIVRKPTKDGIVTSVEFFNDKQEQICQIFGKRKPGIPEDANWAKVIYDYEASI